MKQNISIEQLNELTKDQRRKLGRWALLKERIEWHDRGAQYPLLSIGQMIEFLDDHKAYKDHWHETTLLDSVSAKELCDALFSAVKEILEK